MDTTQVKNNFNGFGPLPNAKTNVSVGYADAFAPLSTSVGVPPPKNIPSKIELYSSNPTRSVSQKFEVNVDYHENESRIHLGDDATGSPQVILQAKTDTGEATMISYVDNNNVTYVDAGVVSIIANGVSCNIDPALLPNDVGFVLVNIGGTNFYVLGCPA
ncbi:MAG: hypothetical protein AN484_06565 [Aphanizomenon flos-aquae WA102]|uniref:Uncharacterized protein n=1 Tax=Aphanizomenon flos-aquae WA102 TaxID=1710896 RepID=A0A1B7X5A6_APHFL|nr:MAG: hypothetical protein AN484_06565 [Aphanizomenon flos-aquae WA102]